MEWGQSSQSLKATDCTWACVPGRQQDRRDKRSAGPKVSLRSLPVTVVASPLGIAGRLLAATLFATAVTVAAGNASASIDRTLEPISPVQNGIVMPPIATHRAVVREDVIEVSVTDSQS